jgi:Domain of unknown function (DUF5615)
VRILLDENMPDGLLAPLRRLGHAADSVDSLRFKGLANARLYREVAREYDLFFTKDRALGARVRTLQPTGSVKVILTTIRQMPEAEFVAVFMAAFARTDWKAVEAVAEWPK